MSFYRDMDLSFEKNIQNDIDYIFNEIAIQQSLQNIILPKRTTYNHFQLETMGTNIERLLGNRANRFTALQIEDEISSAISNFEPRIKLINIKSKTFVDTGIYELNITYLIILTNIVDTLKVELSVII